MRKTKNWKTPISVFSENLTAGASGEVTISIQNLPSPDNPSTSLLAAPPIITLFKNLDRPLVIET